MTEKKGQKTETLSLVCHIKVQHADHFVTQC